MKITRVEMRVEDWNIYIQYIKGAPGFNKIPYDYQAVIGRVIYTADVAKKYGIAYPDHFEGKKEAHLQLVGLGYGNTVFETAQALLTTIHSSDTPDKDMALEAIRDVLATLVM